MKLLSELSLFIREFLVILMKKFFILDI